MFLYLEITSGARPFFDITEKHHVDTILQNAAIKSVSSIPHRSLLIPAAYMVSRAIATPWDISFSAVSTNKDSKTDTIFFGAGPKLYFLRGVNHLIFVVF